MKPWPIETGFGRKDSFILESQGHEGITEHHNMIADQVPNEYAHLFAASREMYQALKMAKSVMFSGYRCTITCECGMCVLMKMVTNALAKAEK